MNQRLALSIRLQSEPPEIQVRSTAENSAAGCQRDLSDVTVTPVYK